MYIYFIHLSLQNFRPHVAVRLQDTAVVSLEGFDVDLALVLLLAKLKHLEIVWLVRYWQYQATCQHCSSQSSLLMKAQLTR
jgi:hypothetical protein